MTSDASDTPFAFDSRRAHERLMQYWLSLKGTRNYPREDEVDPEALEPIWDSCFLVTLIDGRRFGFRYEYMGSELLEAYGRDMTGLAAEDPEAPQIASLIHALERAAAGETVTDGSVFTNSKNVEIRYRCCLVPLGAMTVEYILGCMRWKHG